MRTPGTLVPLLNPIRRSLCKAYLNSKETSVKTYSYVYEFAGSFRQKSRKGLTKPPPKVNREPGSGMV
jgi:hypothetical protein